MSKRQRQGRRQRAQGGCSACTQRLRAGVERACCPAMPMHTSSGGRTGAEHCALTVADDQQPQQGEDAAKYPHQHGAWVHGVELREQAGCVCAGR